MWKFTWNLFEFGSQRSVHYGMDKKGNKIVRLLRLRKCRLKFEVNMESEKVLKVSEWKLDGWNFKNGLWKKNLKKKMHEFQIACEAKDWKCSKKISRLGLKTFKFFLFNFRWIIWKVFQKHFLSHVRLLWRNKQNERKKTWVYHKNARQEFDPWALSVSFQCLTNNFKSLDV